MKVIEDIKAAFIDFWKRTKALALKLVGRFVAAWKALRGKE